MKFQIFFLMQSMKNHRQKDFILYVVLPIHRNILITDFKLSYYSSFKQKISFASLGIQKNEKEKK